jgi:hypothetical protein
LLRVVVHFDYKKSEVKKRTEFHPLEYKLRVLMNKFIPDYDFDVVTWSRLLDFKQQRDSLVHPKNDMDETLIATYRKNVQAGLTAIIEIMNELSLGIFAKPLRQQLLDMIPD